MEFSLKKNVKIFITMNISLILFAIFYVIYFDSVKGTVAEVRCRFKEALGFYCPGCGASRSLKAFIHFDFIKSFILYPPITVSALVILDYDIKLIITFICKNTKITDRFKYYTFLLIPASVIISFVVKNILLFFFKIDTVGDFI